MTTLVRKAATAWARGPATTGGPSEPIGAVEKMGAQPQPGLLPAPPAAISSVVSKVPTGGLKARPVTLTRRVAGAERAWRAGRAGVVHRWQLRGAQRGVRNGRERRRRLRDNMRLTERT